MTTRLLYVCPVLSLNFACSQDFNLAPTNLDAQAGDTGIPDDTAVYFDTGEEPEEDSIDEPVDEDDDPPDEDDCDHTSDLVYVIDQDSEVLYLFEPEGLSLVPIGTLDCTMWAQPESMGVARDGYAYVRYSDESVFRVDVETLACEQTDYRDSQTHFGSFGMGYATEDADTWRDRLYVANEDRVALLDTETWQVSLLGPLSSQAELTGNAEGELWAFLPLESPAELVRLDRTDASPAETILMPGFPSPYDIDTFAFATWGGDFWLFVRTSGLGSSTDVYRVTTGGDMTRVAQDIGINVVGAGVSTCAPTE